MPKVRETGHHLASKFVDSPADKRLLKGSTVNVKGDGDKCDLVLFAFVTDPLADPLAALFVTDPLAGDGRRSDLVVCG
jgi:hypothetical protein